MLVRGEQVGRPEIPKWQEEIKCSDGLFFLLYTKLRETF